MQKKFYILNDKINSESIVKREKRFLNYHNPEKSLQILKIYGDENLRE